MNIYYKALLMNVGFDLDELLMITPKAILLNAISVIALVHHSNNAPKTTIINR